uniref:Uncharacterized protein n=1 Tax=viral metagenome TaxID=1070528 RepID=A0A6C0BFK8_9ZZZZ
MFDKPVMIAIGSTIVVYGVMYYIYEEKRKKENKKTITYKNETVILTSLIAGLVSWYIANRYYYKENITPDIIDENKQVFDNMLQSSSVTLLHNSNEEFNGGNNMLDKS